MLKWFAVSAVAGIAGATSVTALLFLFGVISGPSPSQTQGLEVSYADFLAVSMTAITVVLAALAIGVAIIAFKTIHEIKRDANKAATDTARASVPTEVMVCVERMEKQGRFDEIIERSVYRRSTLSAQAEQELAPGYDPEDMGER